MSPIISRRDEASNVQGVFEVNGFSFGGHGQNAGLIFVKLTDWSQRPGERNTVQAIAARAMAHFKNIKDAQVFAFAPPAVLELGNATGFDFELLDQNNAGHAKLMEVRNQLLAAAAKDPRLVAVRPNGMSDEPQYTITIDREKASAAEPEHRRYQRHAVGGLGVGLCRTISSTAGG